MASAASIGDSMTLALSSQDDVSFAARIPPSSSSSLSSSSVTLAEAASASSSSSSSALEHANARLVRSLYEALAASDAERVGELVHEDLEWWFYGPRREQHMMRLLTGAATSDSFAFRLTSVRAIGSRVFVEGEAPGGKAWVHIWTLKDRRVTQLREYFNTAILVTDLRPSAPTPHEVQHHPCVPLWQNQLWKSREGRELPGLILAI